MKLQRDSREMGTSKLFNVAGNSLSPTDLSAVLAKMKSIAFALL